MIKFNVSTIGEMYVHDHETGAETEMANHELFVVDFLMKNVKEDSKFMDIGGYEGYFTLLMGKKITKGMVYTFEPCAGSYEIIKKNIELHKLDNVKLFHGAVTDKKSTIALTWRPGAQCVSRTYSFPVGVDNNKLYYEYIPTICLDDCMEKIDLMKIDIEGGEVELFQGAKNFFNRNKDCKIVLELHSPNIKARGIDLDKFTGSLQDSFDFYGFNMEKYDTDILNKNMANGGHYVMIPRERERERKYNI